MTALLLALMLTQLRATAYCPAGECIYQISSSGTALCRACSGGGGGAPTTATYITQTPDGTLSNEQALSALATGLIKNTTTTGVLSIAIAASDYAPATSGSTVLLGNGSGGFSNYAGSSCAANQWATATSTAGALTCTRPPLSSIGNPTGDTTFTFPSGNKALWTFTGNTDVAFSIDGDGAFAGNGDLVHIHKSGTGSTAGADALHVEVTSDTNMVGLRLQTPNATTPAAIVTGTVVITGATSVTGNLTQNGGTTSLASLALGTVLPQTSGGTGNGALTCAANERLTSNGTVHSCSALPAAPTDLSGEGFWVKTASGNLSNEVAMGALGTGLVLNTTTTGVPTIYGGSSCTNQFARSTNASGVITCAGVGVNDFTANQGTTTQVLHGNAAGQPSWGGIVIADLPTITVAKGGSNLTTVAANQVYVGTAADTFTAKTLPSCSNSTTSKLLYDNATQTFSCGTDQTSAGGGYATIQDEGTGLTARTTLNFAGAGVSCADDTTRTTCTIAGGSGAPGGSTTQIQYNNASAFAGMARLTTDGNDPIFTGQTTHPAAPAASNVKAYAFQHHGSTAPALMQFVDGDAQVETQVFPFTASFDHRWGCLVPAGSGNALLAATGFAPPSGNTTGTAAAVNWAVTDERTRHSWVQFPSATTASSSAGVRANADVIWRGNAANLGGWYWWAAVNIVTTTANQRFFAGLKDATAVITATTNPSASLDTVYFGCDAAQTTLRICSNDNTGAATCTDLGASFPCTTANIAYDFALWAAPNAASIGYYVRRLVGGQTASGTLSTDLPRNTVALGWDTWINNGGTAAASTMQFGGTCYIANP